MDRSKGGYNKRLVLTMPARRSFSIRARHKNWWCFRFVLPVRALAWPHKRSVSLPSVSAITTAKHKNIDKS